MLCMKLVKSFLEVIEGLVMFCFKNIKIFIEKFVNLCVCYYFGKEMWEFVFEV